MRAFSIAAVLVMTEALAWARGHHGHGGHAHGSHHHHGGMHHSRPSCKETDPVVGYQRCSRFGSWGGLARMPALTIEVGVLLHRFDETLTGPEDGSGTIARTISPSRAALTATGAQLRLSLGLPGPLYAAAESDWGVAVSAPGIRDPAGAPLDLGTGGYFAMRGVLGARARASSNTTAGVELAGGWRMVSFGGTTDGAPSMGAARAEVQLRARGEYWLSPWLSVNAAFGTSVLARGDWNASVSFAMHLRAFDARW